jgi:hypothetical protein
VSNTLSEAQVRDLIATNIECLKGGLTFLDKEKYIPNTLGTRSFIDLYATDNKNRHVLIEIKKSNSTAREALHEVVKYLEGVKSYFSAKESEIHVIIASTEWSELLVPYSRFIKDMNISIEGIVININETEMSFSVESVEPLKINQGRAIAPWHHVRWYLTKDELNKGIPEIEEQYKRINIEDYVIVVLQLRQKMTDDEKEQYLNSVDAFLKSINSNSTGSKIDVPQYEFCVYHAKQIIDDETCISILHQHKKAINEYATRKDSLKFEELIEDIMDLSGEEKVMMLNTQIDDIPPFPQHGHLEIGYPAKLKEWIRKDNPSGCNVIEIKRYGTFERNALLSDSIILSELMGDDGISKGSLSYKINVSNKAELQELKIGIDRSLHDNPVWKKHLHQIINEIVLEFPDSEIDVRIFNPCTGVHTIYRASLKDEPETYLPQYSIVLNAYTPKLKDYVRTAFYYGLLCKQGKSISYDEFLLKYFENDSTKLALPLSWGGYDQRDVEILKDLGLSYKTFKIYLDWSNPKMNFIGDKIQFLPEQTSYIYNVDGWTKNKRFQKPPNPADIFGKYISSNEKTVLSILKAIAEYDRGDIYVVNGEDA